MVPAVPPSIPQMTNRATSTSWRELYLLPRHLPLRTMWTTQLTASRNMFASLQVEDTSEDADDQACITSQPASASPLTETDNSVQYGIEEDENMAEIDFAIFSVFEDVHRLRAETQRL